MASNIIQSEYIYVLSINPPPPETNPYIGDFFKLLMKWKLIHLPSVYSLTLSLICPQNALVSHLKLVPGCFYTFYKIFRVGSFYIFWQPITQQKRGQQLMVAHYSKIVHYEGVFILAPLIAILAEASVSNYTLVRGRNQE